MQKPVESEYPEFYSGYVQLVIEEDIIKFLKAQKNSFAKFIGEIPGKKLEYRYAEGKWTIKEILGHVTDTERIMAFRALAFSRGESQMIPGFDENLYVEKGGFAKRNIEDLLEEFSKLRASNLELFKSFDEKMLDRKGIANDKLFSVRSMIYIIPGHLEHHKNVISNRYLK